MNWVYWSLSYELTFYLVLAISLIKKGLKWPLIFLATAAALFAKGRPPDAQDAGFYPLFFLNMWSMFGLGIAIAEWRTTKHLFAYALGALCLLDLFLNRSLPEALTAFFTASSIVLSFWSATSFLNRETCSQAVGRWSYSLYLLHVPIGVYILGGMAQPLRFQGPLVHALADLAVLSACILAAFLSWKLIERPTQTLWKRLEPSNDGGPVT